MRGMLAGCIDAVVAGAACAGHASVVKAGTQPAIGGVANVTLRGRCRVRGVFPGRGNAIVAATASAQNSGVVDPANAAERDGVMTILTGRGHSDMRRRQPWSGRVVMAGIAGREDANVVESGTTPGFGGVAVIADVATGDMFCVFARSATVVMAQHAFHWRAFELPANVTAGAIDEFVLAC